jgi:hypothetical protein
VAAAIVVVNSEKVHIAPAGSGPPPRGGEGVATGS